MRRFFRRLFRLPYYAVVWSPPEVSHYSPLHTAPCIATHNAAFYGGCPVTGVFTRRLLAEQYRAYLVGYYGISWPICPNTVLKLQHDDPIITKSKWR